MSSSTSPSERAWKGAVPWLLALVAVACIESAIALTLKPHPMERATFLTMPIIGADPFQRGVLQEKLKYVYDLQPQIVQTGDSSGFYGIRGDMVQRLLPESVQYANLSCCANLGYRGYYALLDFLSRELPDLRYFVLYVTPTGLPRDWLWFDVGVTFGGGAGKVFGHDVDRVLNRWESAFNLPSVALRKQFRDALFYPYLAKPRPIVNNKHYLEFLEIYRDSRGWWQPANEARNLGTYSKAPECRFPDEKVFIPQRLGKVSLTEHVFGEFADLAAKRGVQLVIVFHPVPCKYGSGAGTAEIRASLERFRTAHPEVRIPFPLVEHWDPSRFTVPAHVNWDGAFDTSYRLGSKLQEILAVKRGPPTLKSAVQ